jgi:hypothetical protein
MYDDTIPQNPDVREALQKRDIDDLRAEIRNGFTGIHQRQDTTNGRIAKAEGNITELEKVNITRLVERKYEKLIWYLFTVAIGVIVGLASFIIYAQ